LNYNYKHTQVGTLIIFLLGLVMLYLMVLTMVSDENIPIGFMIPFFLVIMILFGTLTVELAEVDLELKFGIGLIKKSFKREDIVSSKIVRNKWYYGWGIRFTTHGVLYCVSGLDAIEVKLSNGKQYRIGTDEPDILNKAICVWANIKCNYDD